VFFPLFSQDYGLLAFWVVALAEAVAEALSEALRG
jgi:hypothetical protein